MAKKHTPRTKTNSFAFKKRVRRTSAKNSHAATPTQPSLQARPSDKFCPPDVLEALIKLHHTGRASIRGITFDLAPDELLHRGWQSRTRIGIEMGGRNGPLLRFPWHDRNGKLFYGEDWTDVCVGDHVFVRSIDGSSIGHLVDHPSDQEARLVWLAIRRGDEDIVLPDPAEFFRPNSFSSQFGVGYEQAVGRIREIIGLTPPDWDAQSDREEDEWYFADLANSTIDQIEVSLSNVTDALTLRRHSTPDAETAKVEADHRKTLDFLLDSAVALGYFLAKAEFSPHVPDTMFGKTRREVSKQAGHATGAKKADDANTKWRTEALTIAKAIREKLPHLGQKSLADRILEKLCIPDKQRPQLDTIIRQIRQWEKSGELLHSTAYHKAKKPSK